MEVDENMIDETRLIEPYDIIESQVETSRFPWMDIVLRRWANLLEGTLFDKMGVKFEIEAELVKWVRFDEFCQFVESHQPFYIFETETYGQGVLAINNKFARACLEKNWRARLHKQPNKYPDLSSEKLKKLHLLLKYIIRDFENSWQGIADMNVIFKKVTSHLFRAKVMLPYEKCIVSKLRFYTHGFASDIYFCYPALTLDAISQKHRKKPVIPPESLKHYYSVVQKRFQEMLENNDYDVTAEIGTVNVKMNAEALELQIGQVLPIQSAVGNELTLKINNIPVLTGEVGQSDDNYAVRVLGEYTEKKTKFRKRKRSFTQIQWPKQ